MNIEVVWRINHTEGSCFESLLGLLMIDDALIPVLLFVITVKMPSFRQFILVVCVQTIRDDMQLVLGFWLGLWCIAFPGSKSCGWWYGRSVPAEHFRKPQMWPSRSCSLWPIDFSFVRNCSMQSPTLNMRLKGMFFLKVVNAFITRTSYLLLWIAHKSFMLLRTISFFLVNFDSGIR